MQEKIQELIIMVLQHSNRYQPNIEFSALSRLREDLGLDSFNLAELTVHIEEEFGVDIFEEGLVITLGEIYSKLSSSH
ncbi:MAG: phosphopantetheine-binding protein [Prolixibacteraceae bacterium]|jgi:acyl carrier protein|nr:phosphopantetheine-binding protein [Prolixibacteraceae bacterium]